MLKKKVTLVVLCAGSMGMAFPIVARVKEKPAVASEQVYRPVDAKKEESIAALLKQQKSDHQTIELLESQVKVHEKTMEALVRKIKTLDEELRNSRLDLRENKKRLQALSVAKDQASKKEVSYANKVKDLESVIQRINDQQELYDRAESEQEIRELEYLQQIKELEGMIERINNQREQEGYSYESEQKAQELEIALEEMVKKNEALRDAIRRLHESVEKHKMLTRSGDSHLMERVALCGTTLAAIVYAWKK